MRLIIFAKIPNQVDPVPLDIIDDRPTQDAFKELLRLTKLANTESRFERFQLTRNGTPVDLGLSFSENGVRNGDTLDVSYTVENAKNLSTSEPKNTSPKKIPTHSSKRSKTSTRTMKETEESSSVPGVKIDFD